MRELLPTANIPRSHAHAEIASEIRYLDDLVFEGADGQATTLAVGLEALEADGLIVLHRGRIAWEWYDHGLEPDMQHVVFSVSKSIAGTLAGILIDTGKVDHEDLVPKYLPEMKGTAYETSSIRNLLDMNVGIHFDEDYLAPDGDIAQYRRATGWDVSDESGPASPHLREYLQTMRPDGSPHGETFHYVSTNTDVLGWLFERACGVSYAKLLHQHVWAPMGAQDDAYITLDSRGAARAAGGFCATLRDLARFGEMMRNNGVSDTGHRVVPSWWIDDIRRNGRVESWMRGEFTKMFSHGNYRNQWYIPDRSRSAFCAIGIHGQHIYIDPEDGTVIVRLSSQHIPYQVENDRVWVSACRAIGARLSGSGLRSGSSHRRSQP